MASQNQSGYRTTTCPTIQPAKTDCESHIFQLPHHLSVCHKLATLPMQSHPTARSQHHPCSRPSAPGPVAKWCSQSNILSHRATMHTLQRTIANIQQTSQLWLLTSCCTSWATPCCEPTCQLMRQTGALAPPLLQAEALQAVPPSNRYAASALGATLARQGPAQGNNSSHVVIFLV
jgi:hypothetical protein